MIQLPASLQTPEDSPAPLTFDSAAETVEQSLVDIWRSFVGHLPQLVVGCGVLLAVGVVTWAFRNAITRILRRTKLRRSLQELFARLVYIGLWIVGLLLAAMIVFPGLTPTKALGGLGIASVAVGFAFKDIFENFFAGILILWRFPFDNGDFIECDDLMGRVEEITIRNTMIRRPTGELIVIPNSKLFTNPVEVLTDQSIRRVSIVCGVAYGEKLKEAVRVIRAAVQRCGTIAAGKPVEVLAQTFGSSSVDIEVTWWTQPEPGEIRRSKNEVITAVKGALDAANIEIPFPYRTLTFKEPLSLARKGAAKDDSAGDGEPSARLPG